MDWFGEAPVEIRELSYSHFDSWKKWCSAENCDSESSVEIEGQYLCIKHGDEHFEDGIS